ncbi:MAG: YeeE/YedE family protein [Myxococcota bacterium]
MTPFTPLSATLGGLLIGLAAAVLLLGAHRVAGISGILGRALWPDDAEPRRWRLVFLAGLPLGAALVALANGPLAVDVQASPPVLVAAGLLVGFGTRLGNGCTSGHGVCGMSRGSPRSVAATAVFMAVAVVTVFLTRHVLGGPA